MACDDSAVDHEHARADQPRALGGRSPAAGRPGASCFQAATRARLALAGRRASIRSRARRVLELAAGIGDDGFLAAELIEPGGRLISTDGAEAMVERRAARAAELGLDNVEFKPMEPSGSTSDRPTVDGVLCRWGYMLLADPEAALRETRRVLRPGGRLGARGLGRALTRTRG